MKVRNGARRRWLAPALAVLALLLAAAAVGGTMIRDEMALAVSVEGPDGEVLNAEQVGAVALTVRTDREDALSQVKVWLNDEDVTGDLQRRGEVAVLDPGDLDDGAYRMEAAVSRRFGLGAVSRSIEFEVDATPPELEVLEPTGPVPPVDPVTLRGRVDDPEAEVSVDGEAVPVEGGAFTHTWPEPPAGAVTLRATDPAGNVSERTVRIESALPGAEGGPPVRGVHMSGYSWSDEGMRGAVLAMIDEGRINTVQLDIKDESGVVSHDSQVRLARESGAVRPFYDLEDAVAELHRRGVRVVGRIVNFADPVLAGWAVRTGQLDLVVQNPDGTPYAKYGGFTNFAHPTIRQYNIDLAEEAARAGMDDILYDYVRRPDGPIGGMVFPGIQGSPEDQIVSFLAATEERLEPLGTRLGASVFGIAAQSPGSVAQDIPRMSQHVDYISPMVYPSHWGPGEYGVADPNNQPYDIVRRSLEHFREVMAGSDAHLVVWLQDFSQGVEYGPEQIRAQIQGAADAGVDDWLLWNANARYTAAGIDPLPEG